MKVKLTELQSHQIAQSHIQLSEVLRQIKTKTLKDVALDHMEALERAVQELEFCKAMERVK